MKRTVTDIADNIDLGSGISAKLSLNTLPLSYSFLLFPFNDVLSNTEDN